MNLHPDLRSQSTLNQHKHNPSTISLNYRGRALDGPPGLRRQIPCNVLRVLRLLDMAEVHGNRTHLPDFGRYSGFEDGPDKKSYIPVDP